MSLSSITMGFRPSILANYFEHECEKRLIYDSFEKTDRLDRWQLPEKPDRTNAQQKAGYEWEKYLYEKYIPYIGLTAINCHDDANKKNQEANYTKTIQVLQGIAADTDKRERFVYQATMKGTAAINDMVKQYLSAAAKQKMVINFHYSNADFIRVTWRQDVQKYCLTVIDAKLSQEVKAYAKIQICIYAQMLEIFLQENHLDGSFFVADEGIVWNRPEDMNQPYPVPEECIFSVKEYRDLFLNTYFQKTLPDILDRIANCSSDADVHNRLDYYVTQKCEWCDNFAFCKERLERRTSGSGAASVYLLPYITKSAQDVIKQLIAAGKLGDDSVKSMLGFIQNDADYAALKSADTYFGRISKDTLVHRLKALDAYVCKQPYQKELDSIQPEMNMYEDVRVILTAQREHVSNRVFVYGIQVNIAGKNVQLPLASGKKTESVVFLAKENSEAECNRIDKEFVEYLENILTKLAAHAEISHGSWSAKPSLQGFVMDNYEKNNIEKALFDMLDYLDPTDAANVKLLEKVMTILHWFQGEALVEAMEKTGAVEAPEQVYPDPIIVLSSVINRMVSMPAEIAVTIKGVGNCVVTDPDFCFNDYDQGFFNPISNVMTQDSVDWYWQRRAQNNTEKADKLEKLICNHVRKRLRIENSIIGNQGYTDSQNVNVKGYGLRGIISKDKFLGKASPFSIKKATDFSANPDAAKLYFELQYENLLALKQTRQPRMQGVEVAIDNGDILQVKYLGGTEYEVLNPDLYRGDKWFSFAITEDNDANRHQLMLINDFYAKKYLHKQYPDFWREKMGTELDYRVQAGKPVVSFEASEKDFKPTVGKLYLIFPVYVDYNSEKCERGLQEFVNRSELLDPVSMNSGRFSVNMSAAIAASNNYVNSFTQGQEAVFRHLLEYSLTVLVGPPGTGKTDFIARSVLALCDYYQSNENRSLRVLVSSQSHPAIENVLTKLADMQKTRKTPGTDVAIYKLDRFVDKDPSRQPAGVKLLEIGKIKHTSDALFMNKGPLVVGATAFSLDKLEQKLQDQQNCEQMKDFDLIIIDEASQVRTIDSLLVLERGHALTADEKPCTRYLIVGDDDQLAPIILGKYKDNSDAGSQFILGSIFRAYLSGADAVPGAGAATIKTQINDNFRMNDILPRYSAEKIYGKAYHALTSLPIGQKIATQTINKIVTGDPLLDFLLDPEYPLVLCVMKDACATDQLNFELQLAADLTRELRAQLQQGGAAYPDDASFWGRMTDKGGFGIITPHNEHIARLKEQISLSLGMGKGDMCIGTVDKLQGKEREVILVSYGVYDVERILHEKEFIYSRNRLNVALTRGRAKTIVVLSEALAEKQLKTMDIANGDKKLEEGVEFMQGFLPYMKSTDSDVQNTCFTTSKGTVTLEVYRKKLK